VLDAARLFADEPVLRAVDLGAADGVNSHTLIRDLARERVGRSLIYALVDLPTNAWSVAAEHLRHAFDEAPAGIRALVIPAPGDSGPGSPMSAREPTTPRRRPTVKRAAEQSSKAPPR
jgi:hypothetical protein